MTARLLKVFLCFYEKVVELDLPDCEEEMKIKWISVLMLVALSAGACRAPLSLAALQALQPVESSPAQAEAALESTADFGQSEDAKSVEQEPTPTVATSPEPTKEPEPEVLNPLSGLPVSDPKLLELPPALVSVTNFPPTARPQAGLSFSPIVFEFFIGEGMTRYLALFYGDYPRASLPDQGEEVGDDLTEGMKMPPSEIGPIRSGRLPYEYVRQLFSGFIVMASAYSKVMAQMKDFVNVYGDDSWDINSALMPAEQLQAVAEANQPELGKMNLSGMVFDAQPPEGGKVAHSLWVFYSYLNQVFWRYNEADGSFHRWQDNADGCTFIEQTDRLNGEPLAFENVIILFVDHEVKSSYLIDIDLLYVLRGKALLFRDGQMYQIYWTTRSEEYEKTTGRLRPIRFIDAEGNPFPLKPGQTWIATMPGYIPWWETVDSEKYNQLAAGRSKGSGYWAAYFKLDD